MTIALVGTAGRDSSQPLTRALWDWMLLDAKKRVPIGAHLVSGGAAWADHLAVALYLDNWASRLRLHLPAPFASGKFSTGFYTRTSASAANWYHERFSRIVGFDSLSELRTALTLCDYTYEPFSNGYKGMSDRNTKVALADEMLAYTFGDMPTGGTLDTWNKCLGTRTHISLDGRQ